MARYMCINCGTFIMKSALSDPYMCRDCERIMRGAEIERRYDYLDSLI